jgi:uncharacterized protein YacL (UPF0231 family)
MENNELIRLLNKELAMDLAGNLSYNDVHARLAAWINEQIKNNFEKLVSLLYRIDVSEKKLKVLLQQFPEEESGNIIASLIIERQEEKLKTRKQFSQRDNQLDEEEKW